LTGFGVAPNKQIFGDLRRGRKTQKSCFAYAETLLAGRKRICTNIACGEGNGPLVDTVPLLVVSKLTRTALRRFSFSQAMFGARRFSNGKQGMRLATSKL